MKLNIEKSVSVYNKTLGLVEKQRCYDNVFNTWTMVLAMYPHAKIFFGYIPVTTLKNEMNETFSLYGRHMAFELDGEVIDPTYIALQKEAISELAGYLPVALWTAEEYQDLILKEHKKNGTTSLYQVTEPLENKVKLTMLKNKQVVIH